MKTILLVDDDPHIIKALTQHIDWERLGLTIAATAGDGNEALAVYRQVRPDIVMTDVYLPGMNGIELTQELRRDRPDLPIVILSGYDEFENARQAMRWGVNHFLLKPAGVEEIEKVLAEILLEQDVLEQKRRLEETYKRQIGQMLPYLREKLFYDLLTTRYGPNELANERLEYLGIDRPDEVLAVSLQISRPAFLTKLKERDWQLLAFGASNIIRELLQAELAEAPFIQGYALDYSDHLFVLLLFGSGGFHGSEEREAEQTLHHFSDRLATRATEKISTYLKIGASAGIGSVKRQLCELIDSYLESRKALEAAEFQGVGRVYSYEEYYGLNHAQNDYTLDLKQWNEALNALDPAKAKQMWRTIHGKLIQDGPGSLTDTQTLCVGLFNSLMYMWNDQFPLLAPPCPMSRFLKEIQQHYTLAELIGWIDTLIEDWLCAVARELSEKKGNRLVERVKSYVEQHYSEEISFTAIARELYVHPKYLSSLFKRVTGENFVSYLNRYRIGKAVEYLQTGRHMVYEVSEMVGFKNATYFSQVFKMLTGSSPSDFIRL